MGPTPAPARWRAAVALSVALSAAILLWRFAPRGPDSNGVAVSAAHAQVDDLTFRVVRGPVEGPPSVPRFSPRGQYLAFHVRDPGGAGRVMLAHLGTQGITEVVEAIAGEGSDPVQFEADLVWHPAPFLVASGAEAGGAPVLRRILARRTPAVSSLLAVDRAPGPHAAAAFNASGRRMVWVQEGALWAWDMGTPAPTPVGAGAAGVDRARFEPESTRLLVERRVGGIGSVWEWSADGADQERLSAGPAQQAAWAGPGRPVWLEQGEGGAWSWIVREGGVNRVLATGVRPTAAGGSGLSEAGDWIGWGPAGPERRLRLTRVADAHTIAVKVPCRDIEDVVIAQGFGQAWVAFTCAPKADEPRVLALGNVTTILGVSGD